MKENAEYIARVIEVDKQVVIITGDIQHQVEWPGGQLPFIGDVYAVKFSPSFQIIAKLAKGNPDADIKNGDSMRWRRPDTVGKTRMEALRQRHIIRRSAREYLDGEGFIEIDMPLLVRGTTPDAEIHSFSADGRYLATSTEYQIKRMEIGGFDRVYTLTQNFRRGDNGLYRNQEFTMLEWARVGATLSVIENDMEQLICRSHAALGGYGVLEYQGRKIDLNPPFQRMTVKEAVKLVTGTELEDFSAQSFSKAITAAEITIGSGVADDAGFLFSVLMDYIQQHLGLERPVFIHEWPSFQTSSAMEHSSGEFAERSELFIAGIELGDGFPSLADYKIQQESFAFQMERRRLQGREDVALDTAYLAAMQEGFPSGAGMALGFDRLVMLLTDRADISSVLAFGWEEL